MSTHPLCVLPAQPEPQTPFQNERRSRSTLFFVLRALIGVWFYVWLSACATAPDPAPFADSTRSLAASVHALGEQTTKQLEAGPGTHDLASDFERHWSARDRALSAAADYGKSLVAIFAQTQSAQPAALSASLQSLAHAVGVGGTIGGAGVLVITADTIAFVHAQLALVRASHALDEALTRAQPVIDRIAALIVADTLDLEKIIRAAAALDRLSLTSEFDTPLAFAESIDRRRNEIRRISYSELNAASLEELARIDAFKASVTSDLVPYFARLATIAQRESDSLDAVKAVRAAIESWAAAHQSLAESVRENRPPDTAALAEAVVRLNVLIARMRSH